MRFYIGLLLIWVLFSGCSNKFAEIINPIDNECRMDISNSLESILDEEQGKNYTNKIIANHFSHRITNGSVGIDFTTKSLYGYKFIFQEKDGHCSLNLYEKTKGSNTYWNTVNFINSRDIPNCKCREFELENEQDIPVGHIVNMIEKFKK